MEEALFILGLILGTVLGWSWFHRHFVRVDVVRSSDAAGYPETWTEKRWAVRR